MNEVRIRFFTKIVSLPIRNLRPDMEKFNALPDLEVGSIRIKDIKDLLEKMARRPFTYPQRPEPYTEPYRPIEPPWIERYRLRETRPEWLAPRQTYTGDTLENLRATYTGEGSRRARSSMISYATTTV